MDGYYDATPRRIPRIPITVCGFFGSGHERVGTLVGTLTGLQTAHVTELVEHETGRAVPRLVRDEGLESFRRHEARSLEVALGSTPPGVIVLGSSTTLSDENLEIVLARSAVVYIYRTVESLLEEIRRRNEDSPGTFAPWIPAGDVAPELVEDMFRVMSPRYEQAVLRVDATKTAPQEVAREIIEHFALWPRDGGPEDGGPTDAV